MILLDKRKVLGIINLVFFLFLISFIFAADEPTWKKESYNVSHYFDEDDFFPYNFTNNLTDYSLLAHFSILDLAWSGNSSMVDHSDFSWLPWNDTVFSNSSTGVLNVSSIHNNQTGNFTLNVFAQGSATGQAAYFSFIINATNDAPNFTNLVSEYNFTQSVAYFDYLNATDEESHYPLIFNITFDTTNCSHGDWTGRNANENCSLYDFGFNLTNIANLSASMNFTPGKNDVGTYWVNVSVMDWGANYSCPHEFCDNATYQLNKTFYYSELVKFNVFATLEINTTDCDNKIFQEGVEGSCQINVTTKGETDSINLSSLALLRQYSGGVYNTSWFYANNSTTSNGFLKTVNITYTPSKTEIGNWTINFTVLDETMGQNLTESIYVYVNRTTNGNPVLASLSNVITSQDLETVINISLEDTDFLIPDKNASFGGYNETADFGIGIYNQSNPSQVLSLSDFDITVLSMPVLNGTVPTNQTTAEIRFTPIAVDQGNYTINISVNDSEGATTSLIFNLTINANQFPYWNQTNYNFTHTVNSTLATSVGFGPLNLTGEGYANDSDVGDVLSFTNGSGAPPSFDVTTAGYVDFTPYKQDVGYWSFSVTATDQLGLGNTTTFNFNISNVNSVPLIETPLSVTNASFSGTSMNATEDNYTVINLWVQDDDFKVAASQKTYYNESLTINLTIEGPNTNLFSFNINGAFPSPGNNRSLHTATFTPTKTDVGDYNVTINVTDINGASDFFAFNLSINETSHAPVLDSLVNKTTAVNQTLYYDINATDAEDGNESTGNLTYSYNFISGIDFINNNQTIFNTTSGILNITFNDSQSGAYRLNITVNDTVGSIDFDSFWIYVYASPNITFPASAEVFTLQENVTSSLNFTVNNSVGDNLTYYFYINSVLRYNLSYYGNNTNLTWAFTPNFTDETYGNYTNLTLIVYPSSENLANAINYNTTQSWNTNITHLNSPVEFSGNIGDKQGTYGTGIEINLSGYFTDIDHSDIFYNQPVSFSIKSNTTPSYITSSVSSDWILTLSSIVATSELINVTGNDSSTNATSNNFFVEFTPPVVVTTPSSGSSKTRPVSLKIIMPGPISSFKKERVVVPIKLVNNGIINLNGITLFGEISKDNVVRDDIFLYFDQFEFVSLPAGVEEETNLTIDVNTEEVGTYEITINATVDSPIYNDWGKIYLTVQEGVKIEERILFTEEFIADNPECLELQELVEEAKRLSAAGEPELARLKTEEAINACKETISQQGRSKLRDIVENNLYRYLLFGTIFSFFVGLSYYSYRRMQLRKRTFSINNLKRNEKIIKIKESI